jgi:adenosylcobinamide-GDP ribazoletransferase
VKGFFSALKLLSVIPIKANGEYKNIAFYFGFVGALIGLICGLLIFVGQRLWGNIVAGALGVTGDLILTGALHFDGLSDIADSFLGAKTKEKRIEILKDPHVGAFGLGVGISMMIMRFGLLSSLKWNFLEVLVLVLIYALSRSLAAIVLCAFAPANFSSIASWAVAKNSKMCIFLNCLVLVLTALIYAFFVPGPMPLVRASLFVLIPVVLSGFLVLIAKKLVSGINGDLLGAVIYLSEIATLGVVAVKW